MSDTVRISKNRRNCEHPQVYVEGATVITLGGQESARERERILGAKS